MNPDPNNPTGQPPTTPPAPAQGAPAPSEADRPMTRAEFAAAQDSMFANMRRMVEGIVSKPPKTPAAPGTPAPTEAGAAPAAPVDVSAAIRREREISEAMGDHPHLGREQRAMIRSLIDAENPSDVQAFIAAKAKVFPAAGPPPTTPNPGAPPAGGRPVSDGGAPASAPPVTEDTPLWKMDQISRDRLIKEKGLTWFRAKLKEQAKGTRVQLRQR